MEQSVKKQDEGSEAAWLSGFMDGEASAEGTALSAEGRETWTLYHLIGDTLRSDDLAAPPAQSLAFVGACSARLESEPFLLAPSAPRTSVPLRRRVLPALAVAAAATMVWIAVPQLQAVSGGDAQLAGTPTGAQPVQHLAARDDADLDPYFQAHQRLAPDPILRDGAALMTVSAAAGR
ncbi:sigma-E factor negative regulatory protein [Chitinasiproducens palmae]|uniref:Anti sigma-E protein, RseA n=1 Tax=Chitinasiproducens palmae TaxID=1770053 RepID=A0A1H2PVM9_9BURK|nr:RseA family anti-sigma factor [Chitinasiproducens palmae]SDV50986.1 anti sigma-E protein, RseA [Chitinasiproducens palmae]